MWNRCQRIRRSTKKKIRIFFYLFFFFQFSYKKILHMNYTKVNINRRIEFWVCPEFWEIKKNTYKNKTIKPRSALMTSEINESSTWSNVTKNSYFWTNSEIKLNILLKSQNLFAKPRTQSSEEYNTIQYNSDKIITN